MKKLLIVGCTDPLMWYANKIDQYVVFVSEENDYYWSREDEGYLNIVKKEDAIIVFASIL